MALAVGLVLFPDASCWAVVEALMVPNTTARPTGSPADLACASVTVRPCVPVSSYVHVPVPVCLRPCLCLATRVCLCVCVDLCTRARAG